MVLWEGGLTSQHFLCLYNHLGIHQAVCQSGEIGDRIDVSLDGCFHPIVLEDGESAFSLSALLVYFLEFPGLPVYGKSQVAWVIQIHHF